MVTDSIGDFITKIKNAAASGKEVVQFPYSKFRESIASVLEKEGYLKTAATKGKKTLPKQIEVTLVYTNGQPKVKGVERISRPSRRLYSRSGDIKPVKNGFGHMIISTSKGVMTDKSARTEKLGGELLFKIW